ncbi:MAG: EI24 domain-containing protein [Saprospiraceae bacterium]
MIRDIITGFLDYFKAIPFIFKHNLYSYFLVSGIISLLLGVSVFFLSYILSDNVTSLLLGMFSFDTDAYYISNIVTMFSGIVMVAIGLLLFKYILPLIISPFMSPLSKKTAALLSTSYPTITIQPETKLSTVRGVRISLRNFFRELLITLFILLLGLFPLFTILVVPLIYLTQAYYFGFGNMDYYLERYLNVKPTIQFVKKKKGIAIGNGAGYILILMIPILGLLIAPVLGTVASTMSIVRKG